MEVETVFPFEHISKRNKTDFVYWELSMISLERTDYCPVIREEISALRQEETDFFGFKIRE